MQCFPLDVCIREPLVPNVPDGSETGLRASHDPAEIATQQSVKCLISAPNLVQDRVTNAVHSHNVNISVTVFKTGSVRANRGA